MSLQDAVDVLKDQAAGKTTDQSKLISAALALDTAMLDGNDNRDLLDAAAVLRTLATADELALNQAGCDRAAQLARVVSSLIDVEAACRWRERFGYTGRGGVVVLFESETQGWVNELRNPEHWQPGCVAVDEAGHTWTTVAGNEQSGAQAWMPNNHESWASGRAVAIPKSR